MSRAQSVGASTVFTRSLGAARAVWAWITASSPRVDADARGWGRVARIAMRVAITLVAARPSDYVVRRGGSIRRQMRLLGGTDYIAKVWPDQ